VIVQDTPSSARAKAKQSRVPAFRMASGEAVRRGTPTDSEEFMRVLNTASPMQWVDIERQGVDAAVLGDLAKRMEVSYSHLAETVGIPKATAARKLANNEKVSGAAAIALARLLALADDIVADSTAPEAETFNTAKWLGQWIEQPQPALGGRKPSELLDTPTGVAMVTQLLGAIRSGAYQ
jgi:putative toxin-antitoxin system antitoxin component (TIGR02293 family)